MTDLVARIQRGLALGANTDASAALDELCASLTRAVYLGMHLHAMIPREVWIDSGGDDGQGHYEGDYHAEKVAVELRRLGDIVSVDAGARARAGSRPDPRMGDDGTGHCKLCGCSIGTFNVERRVCLEALDAIHEMSA